MPHSCRLIRPILALLVLTPLLFFSSGCDSSGGRDGFERRCLDSPKGEVCDQKYALCIAANCSSIWSTASDEYGGVLSFVPQCTQ